jgi:hypothetical protein
MRATTGSRLGGRTGSDPSVSAACVAGGSATRLAPLPDLGTADGAKIASGSPYLRALFVAGALSVIRYAKIHGTKHPPWLTALLARRPTKVAAIALANKIEWSGP